MMRLKAGTYSFNCDLMPWTLYELEDKENVSVEVSIDLTDRDIRDLVKMMKWAWENEWFEHSTSETVFTELMKKHAPSLFERVYQKAHQQFCRIIPDNDKLSDFGVYEVFQPEEIVDYARDCREQHQEQKYSVSGGCIIAGLIVVLPSTDVVCSRMVGYSQLKILSRGFFLFWSSF